MSFSQVSGWQQLSDVVVYGREFSQQRKENAVQEDIVNTSELHSMTVEFRERLMELNAAGLLRHGLAAMALAMQEEMTRYDNWGKVAHGSDLELIMRGVYSILASDGSKSRHATEKISLGYSSLMCSYHETKRREIAVAFAKFRELLT